MDPLENHNLDYKHLNSEITDCHNGSPIFNEETSAKSTSLEMDTCLNVGGGEPSIFKMFGELGIGAALHSVAHSTTWSLKRGAFMFPQHQLFAMSDSQSDNPSHDGSSPEDQENKGVCRDRTEEPRDVDEMLNEDFESNFFHNIPLYQEYLLKSVKTDLQRVHQTGLSDLVASQCLPGLQSPPCSPRTARASPSRTHLLEDKAACSLWQELHVVKEQGLLEVLTAKEVRRQETMFELLTSEASYLKSLRVAVNHFQCANELKNTLSSVEHHILFSNLRSVCGVSERFLLDLEHHLQENVVMSDVGDIVLHHQVRLREVYVPYVTNMMYQEALISKLIQKNQRFMYILHKLEKDAKCQRQTLKSFLVLPFQRITRVKLILEATLKLTDPDELSRRPLTKAICALHEIVNECNQNVLCMKRTEELVHLEKLVDFGQIKAIPLITHGRYLIHEGRLRQTDVRSCPTMGSMVSFSEVYLHLFNDLLLLSVQKEGHFSVQDYAWFPCSVHTEDLKAHVLGLPAESFLLHLTPSHTGSATALVLVASTCAEKEVWVNALNSHQGEQTPVS